MKKIRSHFSGCLLVLATAIALSAGVFSVPARATPATAFNPPADTTRISCVGSDTAVLFWYNQVQAHVAFNIGFTFTSIPSAPGSYAFPGGCADTLSYRFDVMRSGSTDTSVTYVLIVQDSQAPRIVSAIADSLSLDCTDPVPDSSVVTVTDNCALDTVIYNEVRISGDCPSSYKLVRTWDAWDLCGRHSYYRQVITVADNTPPVFAPGFPAKDTIDCTQSPHPDSLSYGRPVITDNCDPSPELTYWDQVDTTASGCGTDYSIERRWSAIDSCRNVRFFTQIIYVRDLQPPSFIAPRDTTLDCTSGDHPSVSGRPTNIRDNCAADGSEIVTYRDVLTSSSCLNTYTIRRTWLIADPCGNVDSVVQYVHVRDTIPPAFTQPALDLQVQCGDSASPDSLFWNWIGRHGDAQARDNCAGSIRWVVRNAGTSDTISFPAPVCNPGNPVVLERRVDFIAVDACGWSDTSTAVFRVLDVVPPILTECPSDTVVVADGGGCTATFTLPAPVFTEECSFSVTAFSDTLSSLVLSADTTLDPGFAPVKPMSFLFALPADRFILANEPGTLKIRLLAVDGENTNEYFLIKGEDGTLLGKTNATNVQCGNSETTLALTVSQINAWGKDGYIEIHMEPFVVAGQSSSAPVNPLCNGGKVEVILQVALRDNAQTNWAYSINGATPITAGSVQQEQVALPVGENTIRYIISDCAGQADSCTFKVTVEDREPPQISCPADTNVVLAPGACTVDITLPFAPSMSDNCTPMGVFQQRLPLDKAQAFLTFSYNAKLSSFTVESRQFTFTSFGPGTPDSVSFTVYYKGDFSSPNAVLQIRGEGNVLLGTTPVGGATCSSEGKYVVKVSKAQFDAWASDGQVVLSVVPLSFTSPSGVSGEGVNPCNPASVQANGQSDGVSYVFIEMGYGVKAPDYFSRGATIIPRTASKYPENPPSHTFQVGTTQMFYIATDAYGNEDTCSFFIQVEDREAPIARCQPTTLFINPAGLDNPQVNAQEVDAGSTDNCRVARFELTPNTFSCSQAGTVQNVTLTVFDAAGNQASCSTIVRIENKEPQPSANTNLCGSDTLFLKANPPLTAGGVLYTYKWSGPNGFTSNKENPQIPGITSKNAGSYTVEITGITGCKSSGVVEVSIEDLPLTPQIIAERDYCQEETVTLQSSVVLSGSSVRYRWYKGTAPNGVLVDTTVVPVLVLNGPHPEGIQTYYLSVESNGCVSQLSVPLSIRFNQRPVAIPNDSTVAVCEEGNFSLGTEVFGTGISYAWTGPNGYASSSQFPTAIVASVSTAGNYQLVVSKNGCRSNPAYVSVSVIPKPPRPDLSSSGSACSGGDIILRTTAIAPKYFWLSPTQFEFSNAANSFFLSSVTKSVEGAWRVAVMVQGCRSDYSLPVSVVVNELPRPVITVSPPLVCEGGTLNLLGAPTLVGATYQWLGPANFSATGINATIPNVSKLNAGNYALTIKSAQGCEGTTILNVDVKQTARIVAVTNDGPDCLSGSTDIRLTAAVFPEDDGTYAYQWTGPNGYTSTAKNAIIPKATQAMNGSYRLVVTNTLGCVSAAATSVVSVTNPPLTPSAPRINELAPGPVCEKSKAMLCTDAYQGTQVVYSWITPNRGIVSTTTPCLEIASVSNGDAGAYAVFVTVDGCRSQTSLPKILVVSPKPVISASSNSPVCAGTLLELRTTVIAGATYAWSGPNFSSTLAVPQIIRADSARNAGLYAVYADLNGCRSDTVRTLVSILPTPPTPDLMPANPVCMSTPGAALSIQVNPASATAGASYSWSSSLGTMGTTQEPSYTLSNFSGFKNGTYTFMVQARLGACPSALSAPLEVELNTIPSDVAFAGVDNDKACDAAPIYLEGQEPLLGSGFWTLISGPNKSEVVITSPVKGNTAVQHLKGPNTYVFRWTLSNGACKDYSFDEVKIMVSSQDTAFAGKDQLVCLSPDIRLAAKPSINAPGEWSQSFPQATLGVRIVEPTNPNSRVTGLQPGNLYSFNWTVKGCGGEPNYDEVLVLISDPDPYAGKDQSVCTLDAVARLQADMPSSGSKGRWRVLTPGATIDDPAKLQPIASNLQSGDNYFLWEIDEGICDASSRDTVVVRYTRSPEAFPDTLEVPFGQTLNLPLLRNDVYQGAVVVQLAEKPVTGAVKVSNDSILAYTPGINFVGQDQFRYTLCSAGCSCSEAVVQLVVGRESACEVPTVITPNNDGINDLFVVPCLLDGETYTNSQVLVFNRSGNEVYRSRRPYQNNWGGTFNGEDLPVGTYYYIVDLGDGSTPMRGFFVIQR